MHTIVMMHNDPFKEKNVMIISIMHIILVMQIIVMTHMDAYYYLCYNVYYDAYYYSYAYCCYGCELMNIIVIVMMQIIMVNIFVMHMNVMLHIDDFHCYCHDAYVYAYLCCYEYYCFDAY